VAIRPTDLQLAIISSAQSQPISQHAEESPRAAAAAAQSAFASQIEERQEKVTETGHARGNRIEVNDHKPDAEGQPQGRRRRRHMPGEPFEEPALEAAVDPDEPPHLIDFTA
jgi:hypothetical protein